VEGNLHAFEKKKKKTRKRRNGKEKIGATLSTKGRGNKKRKQIYNKTVGSLPYSRKKKKRTIVGGENDSDGSEGMTQ